MRVRVWQRDRLEACPTGGATRGGGDDGPTEVSQVVSALQDAHHTPLGVPVGQFDQPPGDRPEPGGFEAEVGQVVPHQSVESGTDHEQMRAVLIQRGAYLPLDRP